MRPADTDLFEGRHFDQQVIILCVRWYLGYKLSSRDLVEMMGERGIEVRNARSAGAGTHEPLATHGVVTRAVLHP
jgi:hypothetical protein